MKAILICTALAALLLSFKLATPANPPSGKPAKQKPAHVEKYIKRFLKTAQREADLYNIPVSITLAQGIIESNSGRSDLSRKHNNHFGMKWHRSRKEKYAVFRDDTPTDRFVVYKSAWWSYRDHSKLLVSARYRHLTKLKRTDYKRWARGLKKAGYATAPHYATVLINIIETYDLDKYDR
jgi:flagellum-specific peptidoglycan hydrolase FlgJ